MMAILIFGFWILASAIGNARDRFLAATIIACSFALSACDRGPAARLPTAPPATSANDSAAPSALRIVSLSPAISRTLVDLDLAEHIVGRSPYCQSLDQSLPVVGDLHNINFEMLVQLEPTHVLVQPPAGGMDAQLARVARKHGWKIAAWRLDDLDDIRTLIREIPAKIGSNLARDDALAGRAAGLLQRFDAVIEPSQPPGRQFKGTVLMVNAVGPVMAFGADTYLDGLLKALGGVNAVADRGWVQLSMEDVVRLSPEAIIIVKPNAAEDVWREAGALASMDVPAMRSRRVALLDHPDAFLPSSGVIGVANSLRAILQTLSNTPAEAKRSS